MSTTPSVPPGPEDGGDPLRVVVVDDERPIRMLLRTLLGRDERFEVVDEVGTVEDALRSVLDHQPDVVLLDLLMGSAHGREIIPQLLSGAPTTMVLALSALSAEDEADAVFAAGAFAYLEKSVMGRQLPDEIAELHQRFRQALAGETVWAVADPARVRS